MAKRSTIQNDPLDKLDRPTGEAIEPAGAPEDAPGPARRSSTTAAPCSRR